MPVLDLGRRVTRLLRRVNGLFLTNEITIDERGRLVILAGGLRGYVRALDWPSQGEAMDWFASQMGPIMQGSDGQMVVPQRRLDAWVESIQANDTELMRAHQLLDELAKGGEDIRAILFLLIVNSEMAGQFAGPILKKAEEERFELPYTVRRQLEAVMINEASVTKAMSLPGRHPEPEHFA